MKDPRQLPSQSLVFLQFGLFFLLAGLAAPAATACLMPLAAWAAAVLALALGVWALSSNPLGNFNIRPIPKTGGRLITHGPYQWIRHPMYTAFLLAAFALARTGDSGPAWLAWTALAITLNVKARLEERWMQEQHSGYADYRATTRRFLPGLV